MLWFNWINHGLLEFLLNLPIRHSGSDGKAVSGLQQPGSNWDGIALGLLKKQCFFRLRHQGSHVSQVGGAGDFKQFVVLPKLLKVFSKTVAH